MFIVLVFFFYYFFGEICHSVKMSFEEEIGGKNLYRIFLPCIFLWISFTTIEAQQQKCMYLKPTAFLDCRNKNLTSVPTFRSDTRVLDLSNNNIQRLNQSSFNSYSSVTELYLANNNISSIHYSTFENLISLRILDLSKNQLQNVFSDIPVSLEILFLDGNPLLGEYIFQEKLQYLRYLSLEHVNLTKVPPFGKILPVLKYLNLDNNGAIQITEDDLRSFKALKTLVISPRVFGGRGKVDNCRAFGLFAQQRNVEVKNLICHNNKNFDLSIKSFERQYINYLVRDEGADEILNRKVVGSPDLFSLQTLISKGLGYFFKALLVEKKEAEGGAGKIRESVKMEDYVVKNPELALRNVFLSGFPLFKNPKTLEMMFSSVDAENLRRFKMGYKSINDENPMILNGTFNFYTKVYQFSCEFTKPIFEANRSQIRMNDFTIQTTRTEEQFQFEREQCTRNDSWDRVIDDKLLDMMNEALSIYWLDHAINIAHSSVLDRHLRNQSRSTFTDMYKNRILSTMVQETIDYLKTININSFDVSPSAYGSLKENSLDMLFENQVYNIKIFNMFNFSNYDTTYKINNERGNVMKVLMTTMVHYPFESSAILAISSKQDPDEVITFYLKSIEVGTVFEFRTINKVTKIGLLDANVKLIENEQKRDSIVIQVLKKYLNLELSKEFQRALTFLMSKIDYDFLNF